MTILDKIKKGVYVIAEMSANHNGDLKKAIELIHIAKKSGADCLKIQTYTADSLTIDCDNEYFKIQGGLWDGYKLYDLYKGAATPYEWQKEIKKTCEEVGIDFLSTPFDKAGVDFLEDLGVEAYKVASFELVDLPLISYIAKKGKPMIVSCGMGTEEEISEAVEVMQSEGLSKEKIILLKCTSEYPAQAEDMNLVTIKEMSDEFGVTVGLSDHSMGITAPVVAVAMGARVIEKHFCLSRAEGGVDSAFSLEPHELHEMTEQVKKAYQAIGRPYYGPTKTEEKSLVFRRSLFVIKDIKVGEVITDAHIGVIRPGYGLKPKYLPDVIGKKAVEDVKRGTPINFDMVGR